MKARTNYRKTRIEAGFVVSTTHSAIEGTLGEKIDDAIELASIITALTRSHFTIEEHLRFTLTLEDEVYRQRVHFELSRYVAVFQAMSNSDANPRAITPQMFRALFGLVEQYLEAADTATDTASTEGKGEDDEDESDDDDDDEDEKEAEEEAEGGDNRLELRVMELFRRMDYTNDGSLDFPEFLQLVSGLEENIPEMNMSKVLEEMGVRQLQVGLGLCIGLVYRTSL
jgi:hypothetical protein